MSRGSVLIGLFAVAIAIPPAAASSEEAKREYLFVQTASEGKFRDGLLTLDGIGLMTVYFSDRPDRLSAS